MGWGGGGGGNWLGPFRIPAPIHSAGREGGGGEGHKQYKEICFFIAE